MQSTVHILRGKLMYIVLAFASLAGVIGAQKKWLRIFYQWLVTVQLELTLSDSEGNVRQNQTYNSKKERDNSDCQGSGVMGKC